MAGRSCKKWLKTVKIGFDREELVIQACQNIRVPCHSMSQPLFFHVFTPFFLCFWPIYNHSRVCQNTFEGLSNVVQSSVEDVPGRFCTFPIKIHLLMASLRPDWSNTTERFLYSRVFVAVSGNATVAARSRIALLRNTWATRGRLERRLNSCREEGEA